MNTNRRRAAASACSYWPQALLAVTAALAASSATPPPPSGGAAPWVDKLRDPQDKVRLGALDALTKLGSAAAEAVPALRWTLVNDPSPRARRRAAVALGKVGPAAASAVPDLLDLAADDAEPELVRAACNRAAGLIAPDDPQLRETRQAALNGGPMAGFALDELFAQGDAGLPACRQLLAQPDPALHLRLVRALANDRQSVGHRALGAEAAAHNPDAAVRRAALEAFQFNQSGIPDRATRQSLADALDDKDLDNRRLAAHAVTAIFPGSPRSSSDFAAPIIAHLHDDDAEVRIALVNTLSAMQPLSRDAALALVAVLGDPEPKVRATAAHGLRGVQLNDEAVEALRTMLKGDDAPCRSEAAAALGPGGPRAAVAVSDLIRALADAEPHVRENAATALGGLREKSAVEALTPLLKDPDASVQQAAGDALRKIQSAPKKP